MPFSHTLLSFVLLLPAFLRAQTLRLNELLAANQTVLADPAGDFDDWVEVFNSGPAAVQLAGFFLSDNPALPAKWQIPATNLVQTQIQPGGYLLLWMDDQEYQGPTHAGFKLDAAGENLLLTAPDGSTVLDALAFGPQTADVSLGRWPDGTGDWTLFSEPTPGAPNDSSPAPLLTDAPLASVVGGFFSQPFTLGFSTATPSGQIRLTFDGSLPDETDSLFTQPLDVQQTSVVRARAFAPGYAPGRTTTNTYFFNTHHTFPIVSLVFEPADFYDSLSGIYINPLTLAEAERPVHAEWFEPDGTRGFGLDLAAELSGTGSLTLPQKSLLLKAKSGFGANEIEYAVFPDLPYDRYRRLILRNSGQDWCVTQFRDAAVGSLARDAADLAPVLDRTHLIFQGLRPAVVYFNGEYRGIHNVREQLGADFLERHFDLNEDEVDLIDFAGEALTGDSVAWFEFWNWLNGNHFQNDLLFHELAAKTDLANFTDYCIFQIAADNVDWPTKNWRRFRPRTPDGRWVWLPFDFDLSFGLLTLPDQQWNTGFAGQNAFARAVDSTSAVWPNPDWSTLPLRRALENAGYRVFFLNRTADLLNTVFRPERVLERLDFFENRYQPEIEQHYAYWFQSPGWLSYWQDNVQKMKDFAVYRAGFCFTHAVETFDDTDGLAEISLAVDPPGSGSLRFSTLRFDAAHLPWTGTYFQNIPIPVRAEAAPGWHFAGWSLPGLGTADSAVLVLDDDLALTAWFAQDSTTDTTVAGQSFFQLSPNPAPESVRLTGQKAVRRIVLYNLLGQKARQWVWPVAADADVSLDLRGLPPGGYAVAVEFEDGKTAWQRLIKR